MAVVAAAGVAMVTLQVAPAGAQEAPAALPDVFDVALDEVGADEAVPSGAVDLPLEAGDPAVLSAEGRTLELSVPQDGDLVSSDASTVVFAGEDSGVALQSTDEGMRALVHISSADSPERYEFDLGGDAATLESQPDGSVVVIDEAGEPMASIDAPWAVDADGVHVPTHFEVDGSTLTQVVEHRDGGFAYGIVADPSAWWWTKNVAICTGQVALVLVPGKIAAIGAKIASMAKNNSKVKKAKAAIDQVGGVGDTLRLMKVYVTSRGKKVSAANKKLLKRIFEYGGQMLAEAMGIGTCYTVFKEIAK